MPFFTKYFVLLLRHTKTRILVCGDIPIQVYNMAIRAEKTTAGSRATFRITARVAPAGGTQGFPPIGANRCQVVAYRIGHGEFTVYTLLIKTTNLYDFKAKQRQKKNKDRMTIIYIDEEVIVKSKYKLSTACA